MKLKPLGILVLMLIIIALAAFGYIFITRSTGPSTASSLPLFTNGASAISQTPVGKTIRFEAVIVDRPRDNCIEVFIPDEFERYNGDSKWAISATPSSEAWFFERPKGTNKAIVTGKYAAVSDVENGPCNIVTGHIFEISDVEYR